jgi:hypothetical protein
MSKQQEHSQRIGKWMAISSCSVPCQLVRGDALHGAHVPLACTKQNARHMLQSFLSNGDRVLLIPNQGKMARTSISGITLTVLRAVGKTVLSASSRAGTSTGAMKILRTGAAAAPPEMPGPLLVYTFVGRRWSKHSRRAIADPVRQPASEAAVGRLIPWSPALSRPGLAWWMGLQPLLNSPDPLPGRC